jgi:hypothetical protein
MVIKLICGASRVDARDNKQLRGVADSGAVQCSELQEYLDDTIGLTDDGLTGG